MNPIRSASCLVRNATEFTAPIWPSLVGNSTEVTDLVPLVSKSQRRSVPSDEPDMTRSPSGEKATQYTELVWPLKGDPTGWPLCVSHRRSVLSDDPDMMYLLSGEKATEYTLLVWPVSGDPMGWPLRASQRRSVPSDEPDIIWVPSGENATEYNMWPLTGSLIRAPLPESQRQIVSREDDTICFLSAERVILADDGCLPPDGRLHNS